MKVERCECGRPVTHSYVISGYTDSGNAFQYTMRVCEVCLELEREMSPTGIIPGLEPVMQRTSRIEMAEMYLQGRESATVRELAVALGVGIEAVIGTVRVWPNRLRITTELWRGDDGALRRTRIVRWANTGTSPGEDA